MNAKPIDTHRIRRDSDPFGFGSGVKLIAESGRVLEFWIVQLDASLARGFMARNKNVRRIAKARMHALAQDMISDAFSLTHQAICFDENWDLIDGQHRCQARIFATEITEREAVTECEPITEVLVARVHGIRGNDPIDRGTPRSIGIIAERDPIWQSTMNALRMLKVGRDIASVPMTLNTAFEVDGCFGDVYKQVIAHTKSKLRVGGIVAAIAYALPIDEDAVLAFADQIATGTMIEHGSAAQAFIRWKKNVGRSCQTWPMTMATLGALRFHIDGKPMRTVYPYAEDAYKQFTARRRALKIPHTPDAQTVPGPGDRTRR